ncbi:transcriptional regulator, CadC [Rhizobium freirei PRF 81]|uniref:Transcriptional regulator, CadC n=1 Tax=Rhizobium freirei PRF 81 TaxID=363754 RepID=N6V3V1_9HYPH|nr:winged helix-turn-helix domain-containing protein [Rhizobium freirei]ENN88535.1 transcriptional regulator, CadC [Rhizobium freirei PRF 81]
MLQFAGFELDEKRSELRRLDGETIKLRPKAFDLLRLFATRPGRVLSKHELMAAIWPDVHVGEDNLFQCIREIRTALGDEKRELIRAIAGRGYLFEPEVSGSTDAAPQEAIPPKTKSQTESEPTVGWRNGKIRRRAALIAIAAVGVSALAIPAMMLPNVFVASPPSVAILPMATASGDAAVARMATGVISDLTDGLAKIETIRVVVPPGAAIKEADLVLNSELDKTETTWSLRANMIEPATGAVKWSTSLSVNLTDIDPQLQRTRLTAAIGNALAQRINALLTSGNRSVDGGPTGTAKAAIEQATASINQTTLERFRTAEAMLEKALADDADSVDLRVALAAFKLRGIQLSWFPETERQTVVNGVGAIMERALHARPDYIPVLETHCRYLSATNRFAESLVACGKALALDPWDGSALYLTGLAQIYLGRFDDALATFKQADRFDTPQVSRWTWGIGAGWACMLMGRADEALPWLQRSIKITPASGRTYFLMAAAYQQLGRVAEAKAAIAKGMELRPGSTALNAPPPSSNTSGVFLKAQERIMRLIVEAGLPEK